MGRDALGHGHDPGEHGNDAHGKGGLFDSGGGGSDSGGHSSAGARAAFAQRAKMKAQPVANVKADKSTKAAAAKGDHQRAQSHDGRGYPVAPHAGHKSVGTHNARGGGGGSGGGGSSGGGMRGGPMKHKLTQNAKERVAIGQATDARRFPGEPAAQTIQFGRGENVPQSKRSYGRGPSGRRRR